MMYIPTYLPTYLPMYLKRVGLEIPVSLSLLQKGTLEVHHPVKNVMTYLEGTFYVSPS